MFLLKLRQKSRDCQKYFDSFNTCKAILKQKTKQILFYFCCSKIFQVERTIVAPNEVIWAMKCQICLQNQTTRVCWQHYSRLWLVQAIMTSDCEDHLIRWLGDDRPGDVDIHSGWTLSSFFILVLTGCFFHSFIILLLLLVTVFI